MALKKETEMVLGHEATKLFLIRTGVASHIEEWEEGNFFYCKIQSNINPFKFGLGFSITRSEAFNYALEMVTIGRQS